uniref:Nose resistant to fluoxetine protein 6 n=1 Tax=Syphacia muris TaxID=451379 RepID=A0A0N5ANE7_9BILA
SYRVIFTVKKVNYNRHIRILYAELFYFSNDFKNKNIARCISIRINGNRCLSTKRYHSYHSAQGLQVLATAFVVTANCYLIMMPYIENVIFSYELVKSFLLHPLNNFSFHIDGFIAVSSLFWTLIILPSYTVLILFMNCVFATLSSGPLWNHNELINRCNNNWWKNLLFINNFFDASDTCLDSGYLISLEAQYFFLLTLMLYASKRHKKVVISTAILTLLASVAYTFWTVTANSLIPTVVVSIGIRFSLLVIGLLIAYITYPYVIQAGPSTPLFYCLYAAVHRLIFALDAMALYFIIIHFIANIVTGELISFLEWRIFNPISKQCFVIFLVSESVFIYLFSSLHRPFYATHWSTLYMALGTLVLSCIIAIALDVFITRPIRNIIWYEFGMPLQQVEQRNMICLAKIPEEQLGLNAK